MKILLVTSTARLAEKLNILNPELEYCAFVVDEVAPAGNILNERGLSAVPLYSMSELKNCVGKIPYDYVLHIQEGFFKIKVALELKNCGVPTDKLLNIAQLPGGSNFVTEMLLRYYKAHAQEFEIFATGISHAQTSINIEQFSRKAINFAVSSQDLYYDFLIAKNVLLYGGGV